jgi:hypothetical protein
MSTLDAQLQRDQQWAGDLDESVREMVMGLLKELHTACPGIIQSYDPATQTATVQAAIKRVFVDDGPVALPLCVDVPVHFPGGGGFVHTFPITAGDECLMVFAERCIDNWWDRGGVQEPFEVRFHDLSDAFALVGVRSKPRFLKNVATDASELRTEDGATVFRLEAGAAIVGQKEGAELAVRGQTYRTAEDVLFDAQSAFTDALASAFNAVGSPADCVAALRTVGAAAGTLVAALGTFKSGVSTYLAQKAQVG